MRIPFSQRIETDRTPQELWGVMERALEDSTRVPEWPNHLSELKMRRDGQLDATYKALGEGQTYRYDLNVDPSAMRFRYDAVQGLHPFTGGATVQVKPNGAGSDLLWEGAYQAGLRQLPQAAAFKLGFEPLFFRALRNSLS
ncbi:MAG: SRPBCC family protein [Myxococcota bacterium]